MIHSKIIGIGVITGLCSMAALAEPAVQPGDTLESLSKVKVTTTVNGQPGSISDLVNSGQVQQVSVHQQMQRLQVLLFLRTFHQRLQQAVKWHLQQHQLMLCHLHRTKRLQRHKIRTLHRLRQIQVSRQTRWQKTVLYQQMHLCNKLNNQSHKKNQDLCLGFFITSIFIFRFDYLTQPHGWLESGRSHSPDWYYAA